MRTSEKQSGKVLMSFCALLLCGCATMHDTFIRAEPTWSDMELAENVWDAALQARSAEHFAREKAHWVLTEPSARRQLLVLRGRIPSNHKTLLQARNSMQRVSKLLKMAPEWPQPRTFEVPFTEAAPVLDGKLDDEVWQQAAIFTQTYPFNSLEPVEEGFTTYRILWNKTHLFFAFDCRDDDIIATPAKRGKDVPVNDSIGIYLLPVFRLLNYWELRITPGGDVYDALNAKIPDAWGAVVRPEQEMAGLQVKTSIRGADEANAGTASGYSVEVAVPFHQLPGYMKGAQPNAGDKLHFMLTRFDRNSEGEFRAYAFQPILSGGHNIWNHYEIELVK